MSLQNNEDSMTNYHALENLLEPKAVMMSDTFLTHWAYRIPRKKAQKILSLDGQEDSIQNYSGEPSTHPVAALPGKDEASEPLVYFKAHGEPAIQPGKEFMLYSLYRYLNIPVPETALLILTNVFPKNEKNFYAVQASEAVTGSSALKAYQDAKTELEEKAYASQVMGALLTNPSDGSFKNYIYSPHYKTLVGIDNDLIFKPEFTKVKDAKTNKVEGVVNVKSVLYLSPLMDEPVPSLVQTYFSTVDPNLMMFLWLHDLEGKNKDYKLLLSKLSYQNTRHIYQNLRSRDALPPLANCTQEKINFHPELPQILISKDLINTLIKKLQQIKTALIKNPSTTPQNLFEEISPILGKCYNEIRLKSLDPEEMQDILWDYKIDLNDFPNLSSLFSDEELRFLAQKNRSSNELSLYEAREPREFFAHCKAALIADQTPLDRLIRRHRKRKRKNLLDLQLIRKELELLFQEGLICLRSPRKAVSFLDNLSTIFRNSSLVQEIKFFICSSPSAELKWWLTVGRYFLRANPKTPNTYFLTVHGVFMKKRIFVFTKSEKHYLFDQHGDILKNSSLTGRSKVTYFPEKNPKFYFKQYPECPGFEFASNFFMRSLGIKCLPYQDLVVMSEYPVLITQNVEGFPVHKIWEDPHKFKNLDPFHTGLLIISAMLINPEDGKEDNFILSEDGKYLIPIDNDHCFLPSFFQKEGSFWNFFTANTALQTKTLLFCLDEMRKPIPLQVKQHILSLNFDSLLPQWVTELDKIENKLNNLGDQTQRNKFLEQGTIMRIPFYKQFIQNLYWKAHKIQDILKVVSQPTPFDLLKAVEPFAAKCYRDSFKQGNNLQTRFRAATENLYKKTAIDGSRVSILNTRTMMEIINISEKDLQKDAAAFPRMGPVDALKLLNQLIEERSDRVQREQELLCELDEKSQEKKWIHLFGNPPAEAALKTFFACPKEGLALRGSKLLTSRKLRELFTRTPDKGMRIRFLSLTDSPVLTNEEIGLLMVECPNIEYLNVSGCMNLKEMSMPKGKWPLLSRLEARDCEKLEKFSSYSPIKILRIGTATINPIKVFVERFTLDIFIISNIAKQFEFSLRKAESFEVRSSGRSISQDNFIQSILYKKKKIEEYFRGVNIELGKCLITSGMDLEMFITSINLQNSNIKPGDIQRMIKFKLVNLKKLDLSRNQIIGADSLKYLIEGHWPELYDLDLSENEINDKGAEILAQGNWPKLGILKLGKTGITTAGAELIVKKAKWTQLKLLDLSSNEGINDQGLTVLPRGNWNLETLNLNNTNITKKSLFYFILNTNWLNLKQVNFDSLWGNTATNLLQRNWHLLESLDFSQSGITPNEIELIVEKSNWPKLKHLILSDNAEIGDQGLKILSRGNWPSLEMLNLGSTGITAKGVEVIVKMAPWTKLKLLDLSGNNKIGDQGLEILSRRNWPSLEMLNLGSTGITVKGVKAIVRVAQWKKLKLLNISGNTEINDDVLEIFAEANWPLMEALDLTYTGITKKRFLNFIFDINWPNLEEIDLNWGAKSLPQKNWHQLEKLNLSYGGLTHKEIELIGEKSNWPQLKHLNLSGNPEIGKKGFESLCRGNWPLLEELNLMQNKITLKEVEVIVEKSNWPQLKYLDLSDNEINDEGIETLSRGNWPLIESLQLVNIYITKKGLLSFLLKTNWYNLKEINRNQGQKYFAESLLRKNWHQLEKLDLSNSKLTEKEIELIVERSNWPQLKHIILSNNSEILISKGLEAIVKMTQWTNLKHLNLSDNLQINDNVLEVLAQAKWPLLETLDLTSTRVTKKGSFNFLFNPNWPNLKQIDFDCAPRRLFRRYWPELEKLDLSYSKFTPKEIELLVEKSNWPRLEYLDLSGNTEIDDKGFEALSRGNWPFLEKLDLSYTNITLANLETFVKNSPWPNLKELHLKGYTRHSQRATIKEIFSRKWPNIEVAM